jgi:holo-[acyl-carrier protein] synthase
MILGLGTDIVDLIRLQKIHKRFGERFLRRILTDSEAEYCMKHKNPYPHIGGRFAVKESVIKAMSSCLDKSFTLKDIEVTNLESGKPLIRFHNGALKVYSRLEADMSITIAHTRKYATATAILETWE